MKQALKQSSLSSKLIGIVWGIFLLSRLFIWIYRPTLFTEIIYSYMPYAHLWAGGTKPYLQQWYEYPPATIPLFYLPHIIDTFTYHHWYHVDYLDAYRGILLLVDIGVFYLVTKFLKQHQASSRQFFFSALFYIAATMKANHFIYDSMDLTFTAAMLVAAVAPVFWTKRGTFIGWFGYFLAVALKYVNAPLGLFYAAFYKKSWKRLLLELTVAGLVIWIVPLALFRRSLLVSFVYHQQRGIQVESAPATIARTINGFTHSEKFVEVYKNYDIQGPVSSTIKSLFDFVFPLSLLVYGLWISWMAFKGTQENAHMLRIWGTLGYISLFMITAKVLSTPFLLWHIPFIALLPLQISKKWPFMIISFCIIAASMTSIPDITLGAISLHVVIGWIRVIGFAWIFARSLQSIKSLS